MTNDRKMAFTVINKAVTEELLKSPRLVIAREPYLDAVQGILSVVRLDEDFIAYQDALRGAVKTAKYIQENQK